MGNLVHQPNFVQQRDSTQVSVSFSPYPKRLLRYQLKKAGSNPCRERGLDFTGWHRLILGNGLSRAIGRTANILSLTLISSLLTLNVAWLASLPTDQ